MVRYLMKYGRKLKQLPPPIPPGEEGFCRKCGENFDEETRRRFCFDVCGHVNCMKCILERTEGCEQCGEGRGDEGERDLGVGGNGVAKPSQVIVLSSVLSKCPEDEDAFPKIQELDLSALPVLQLATDATIVEEEEEEEMGGSLEEMEEEEEEIPVIDLSGDEEEEDGIPVIDLVEEDDEEEGLEGKLERERRLEWEVLLEPGKFRRPGTLSGDFLTGEPILDTPPTSPDSDTEHTLEETRRLSEMEEEEGSWATRSLRKRRKSWGFQNDGETGSSTGFGKHVCQYCHSGFPEKRALGRHLYQEHWDVRPFPCDICDWPFDSKQNLAMHRLTHTNERPFQCSHCESAFNRNYTLRLHLQRIHGVTPEKRQRNRRQQSRINWDEEPAPSPVAIPITITDDEEETVDWTAGIPKNNASSQPYRKMAPPSNGKKYSCCHCGLAFSRKMKLGAHLRSSHADQRPYSCDLCGWSFSQKTKLSLHRVTHTIDRPYKCKQCDSTFNRKYSLERHVRIMHLKKPRMCEAAENKPSQRKTASCPYCPGEFENRDVLGYHMAQEHGDRRPHICHICRWPFIRKKHLVAHLRIHSAEKPHQCKMCEGKFNRRFSLERHLDNVHGIRIRLTPEETPDGEEYCPECQSLFGSEFCVKVAYSQCGHISCMDCVIRAELGCGQCTTENAPKVWSEEKQQMISSPVKPLESGKFEFEKTSEICRTSNKENKEIDEYEFVDDDIKEKGEVSKRRKYNTYKVTKEKSRKTYHCPYCEEIFPAKMDLGIHLQYIHRDLRPFPCDVCQWPFSSYRDLERHQVIHTKMKPFPCHICESSFNRKSTRDRHMDKIHS